MILKKGTQVKIGEAAISNLIEITYDTGISSSPLIAFFNSFGMNHEVVHMLDSKRRFSDQAWRQLNGTDGLKDAINQILSPHYWPDEEERQRRISSLNRSMKIDRWRIEQDDGRLEFAPLSGFGGDEALRRLKEYGEIISHENLIGRIRAIERSVETSPTDAIGAAKELIESITKEIIEKSGGTVPPKSKPSSLVKETLRLLDLAPDDISDRARGFSAIKLTLTSLVNIAHQIDELRALYGSGHGRASSSKGLEPRHARLAVGAASSLCLFLVETYEKRTM